MARSHALDNFRTHLTILVLLHHTSLPYGGIGTWAYQSRSCSYPSTSSLSLSLINLMNQTFFMALFFLLSGYFSALSSKKRSRKVFLKEKWKRLGVPTLVYSVLGTGLVSAILAGVRDEMTINKVLGTFWEGVKSVRGIHGPVWYCATLLVFDGLYALLRPSHFGSVLKPNTATERDPLLAKEDKPQQTISTAYVLLALTITSGTSFLIRLYYPIGTNLWPLSLNLGYAPQYALFYMHGIWTARTTNTGLHRSISRHTLCVLFLLTLLLTFSGFTYMHSEMGKGEDLKTLMHQAMGSRTLIAFFYAVWNEVVGATLSAALLVLFTSKFPRQWNVGGLDVARYSYPAFLVHGPVTVFLQSLFDAWCFAAMVKTVVLGAMGTVGSWGLGVGLVKVIGGMKWRGYV